MVPTMAKAAPNETGGGSHDVDHFGGQIEAECSPTERDRTDGGA